MYRLLLPTALLALTVSAYAQNVVQPGAPGAPSKELPADTRAEQLPATKADIEFMQGMIMHHQQAVEMTALIPTHTKDAQVRLLGGRISKSQSDEIKWMRSWLTMRNQSTEMVMADMPGMHHQMMMPGMLTPEQMKELRHAYGNKFDELFLKGMIQHHGGALTMVHDLFQSSGSGEDPDLFTFATDVDNGQRAEIKIMQKMLKENR